MKFKFFLKTHKFAVIAASLIITVLGCSGGTRGTGGVEYRGTVYSSGLRTYRALAVLQGVTVTIGNTGDSTVTDERGFYSVIADVEGEDVELFFNGQGLDVEYIISVPDETEQVTADFEVDQTSNSIVPLQIQIKRRDQVRDPDSHDLVDEDESNSDINEGDSGIDDSGSEQSDSGVSDPLPVDKVTICHNPDGSSPQTISVSEDALASHLAHGDNMGACPVVDDDRGNKGSKNDKGSGNDNGQNQGKGQGKGT